MKVYISQELYDEISRALIEVEDPDSCNVTYEQALDDIYHTLVKVQNQCAMQRLVIVL